MPGIDAAVADRKAELDRLRPLAPDAMALLAHWYDVELTYSSNAIEGNTLTRGETALVLEKRLTVGGKPLRDHLEAIDHQDALLYVRGLASHEAPVRDIDVRQIHALVLGRSEPNETGRYATGPRLIAGSPLVLPSPAEIRPMMHDFGQWLGRAEPGADVAAEAHLRLVTIHPFADGNGRTARLLMNLLLFKAGYPPVIIGPEHRVDDLDGLEAAQLRHDTAAYKAFITVRIVASMNHYIGILRQGAAESRF